MHIISNNEILPKCPLKSNEKKMLLVEKRQSQYDHIFFDQSLKSNNSQRPNGPLNYEDPNTFQHLVAIRE